MDLCNFFISLIIKTGSCVSTKDVLFNKIKILYILDIYCLNKLKTVRRKG